MKKLYSIFLLALLGLQFQTSFAQLFVASGESINATSSAVFYSKEALAGSGTFKLSSATMQLNPNANYTSTAHKIQATSGTISTVGIAVNTDFTVGQLEMLSSSTLALAGSTVHTLRFSPSSTQTWTGTLTITGWQGAYDGTTGTKGKVFFGSSASGLLASQVLKIKFYDGTYTYDAAYLTTGEVVPVANAIQASTNLAAAMCLGSSQTVDFTYNNISNFISATTFTAQLSDATGAFTSPTAIGTVTGNSSGSQSISATIPSSLTGGAGYRIRVVSDAPGVIGSDNGSDIYIKAFDPGAIASTGESICSGASTSEITSTTAASGGDNSITYSWRSSEDSYTAAIAGATAATYTPPTNLTTAMSYRRYAADGLCNTTPVASTGTWTVGINISLAGTIAGFNSVCSGAGTTLSLSGHSGSIQWEHSNALNGTYSPISSATSPTLSTGNLTAATYYRAAVTNGSCTTSNSDAFLVDVVGTLTNIASITGPATATLGSTVTFSVPVDANAVSFIWDLPAGMTITSSSSSGSTINVAVANNYVTGIVKVKAVNSCFSTPLQTKTVSAPGQAGISITTTQAGAPVICGGTNGVSFSATAASGATYSWTLPTGLTFASGYDGDEQTTQVNFAAGYVGGAISCTRTTATATNTAYYTVGGVATPGSISGPTALCDLTSGTYTVATVPNATSYEWTLPSGMTGTSTTTSIAATWTGTVSGIVKVRALSTSCGASGWRSLSVGSIAQPSGITGPTIICGAATYTITGNTMTQVSQTTLNYSVTNVSGMNYAWTVPTGMTITSGGNTNDIVVEVDPTNFTSGQVSVTATDQANNTCVSAARTLNVSKAVSSITGPTALCGVTTATYSVPSGAGSAFAWTLPSWMTPASGYTLTSNPINVDIDATGTSAQTLSVDITTACGVVTVSRSVGCGLFTQLSASSCGATLPSIGWGISANNVATATAYQFTVTAPNGTDYTITSADRWITLGEASSMPLLYGDGYAIKVRVQLDGSYGGYGASCTVYTPSLPTTTLSTASCGTTLPSIGWGISATNVAAATAYRFNITIPSQGATVYTVESPDRWITLSEAMNGATSMPLLYGTIYSMTVEVESGTGNWGAPGAVCTVTTPSLPTTTLSTSSCGATLPSLGWGISATNVAAAAQYKFEITAPNNTTPYEVSSVDRWITLSEASGMSLLYASNYSIKVKVQNGTGAWSNYGDACTVTTPSLPVTTLSATSCGATLPSIGWGISANNMAAATKYRFNITAPGNTTPFVVESVDRWITLSEAANMPLLYAATYVITVEVENGTGNWGAAGAPCNVLTPAIPTISLSTASCDVTLPSLGWGISATNVAAATQYEFQIINQTLGQAQTEYYVISPDRWITLSEGMTTTNIPLVPQNNQEYVIRVRAYSGTQFGEYPEIGCVLYTPVSQGMIVQDEDPQAYEDAAEGIVNQEEETLISHVTNTWSATTTSNPFEHSFKVNLNGAGAIERNAMFTATLTDMSGKVYTKQTLSKDALTEEHFGQDLAPGMYLMTLRQGEELRVLRVVKR